RAAREWFRRQHRAGRVVLYPTLEQAADSMPTDGSAALMACIAYPDLHTLMFANMGRLRLADCLVVPTFDMVLAARDGREPSSISSHPAPRRLIPEQVKSVRFTTSNAQAAADCRAGLSDGCITTSWAAREYGLTVVRSFGPIDMGFTVHILH